MLPGSKLNLNWTGDHPCHQGNLLTYGLFWYVYIYESIFQSPMSFRIQSKNIFLTYSNVEQQGWDAFTKEELLEFLSSKCPGGYVIVCQEQHEDGSPHFHAVMQFRRKPDIRNSRFFDFGKTFNWF